jgi:predicted DCC family thiol-disulfide oxidoreductase YuxK
MDLSQQSQKPSPITVYYDGGCPICRREIAFYQERTGEAALYCDVSHEAHPAPDLSQQAAMARFHVRLPDGQLRSGAAAFLALWQAIPGLKLAARVLSLWPILPLLDFAYDLFLKIRRLWR